MPPATRFEEELAALWEQAEAAEQALSKLRTIGLMVSSVEAEARAAGLDLSAQKLAAARLRDALLSDDYEAASAEAFQLCRSVTGEYARRRLGASIEVDACPHPETVKALEAMLSSSGRLSSLTRAVLTAGARSLSAMLSNAATAARSWSRIERILSRIEASLAKLERHAGLRRERVVAWLAAGASKAANASEAIAFLEAAAKILYNAAALAEEAAAQLVEATEAQQRCGAWTVRLPCRLLEQAAAQLAAARGELEALSHVESLEAAGAAVRAAEARLREARRSLDAVKRLYRVFTGAQPPARLEEAVEPLLEALQRQAITLEEEEVLGILVEKGTVDIMELHERNPRLSRAALRLCTRGITHCTVSL